jgi:ComF family protein
MIFRITAYLMICNRRKLVRISVHLWHTLMRTILHWFLPPTCVLCRAPANRSRDLCVGCEADLPSAAAGCYQCAQPVGGALAEYRCGTCLQNPPPYDRLFALCYYEFPIRHLITGLKFHNELGYAQVFGELLAERLRHQYDALPEVLIPVPLHPNRLRERGYNQALELARPIAKRLDIPLDVRSCRRIRPTAPQMQVSAAERDKNVQGAFSIDPAFRAKHVALIDDVVTTGHTISELSRVLRQQGVQRIDVICCARTLLSS